MEINLSQIPSVLNSLNEPLLLLNKERTILFMNKPATSLLGSEYIGQNFVRLIRHPDVIGLIATVMELGVTQNVKASLQRPVEMVFEFKVSKIEAAVNNEALIVVALRDLTELENANQIRSDFVANVSHELRSPLTALSGFIETIKGPARDDPEARERFLGLMERESARMVRLIADLLSLSKFEAKSGKREFADVDMVNLVKRAVTTLEEVARQEGKTIELQVNTDQKFVVGVADELTQVLLNLIENALKYGKAASVVRVAVDANKGVAGFVQNVLTVSVEDEGEGIAKEHIPRLTERFYRVDTHRSRDKGGTGLGLAIVKHIVNQHRGRLQISSVQGKGSTFKVHLPASEHLSTVTKL